MREYIDFAAFTLLCIGIGVMIGYRKGYKQATKEAVAWVSDGGLMQAFERGYDQYRRDTQGKGKEGA